MPDDEAVAKWAHANMEALDEWTKRKRRRSLVALPLYIGAGLVGGGALSILIDRGDMLGVLLLLGAGMLLTAAQLISSIPPPPVKPWPGDSV